MSATAALPYVPDCLSIADPGNILLYFCRPRDVIFMITRFASLQWLYKLVALL